MKNPHLNGNGNGKKVMTIREVSVFLRIPVSTLYELAQKGRIPAAKLGKHWRFLEDDILACFHRGIPGGTL